eukprot:GHVU01094587.1.p1 GENE.GHVU01094587.1~~GHVU01094587.1.p1  ORF type:complete len:154 (+),score=12.94 GHVU01094587.1:477-938(+)
MLEPGTDERAQQPGSTRESGSRFKSFVTYLSRSVSQSRGLRKDSWLRQSLESTSQQARAGAGADISASESDNTTSGSRAEANGPGRRFGRLESVEEDRRERSQHLEDTRGLSEAFNDDGQHRRAIPRRALRQRMDRRRQMQKAGRSHRRLFFS